MSLIEGGFYLRRHKGTDLDVILNLWRVNGIGFGTQGYLLAICDSSGWRNNYGINAPIAISTVIVTISEVTPEDLERIESLWADTETTFRDWLTEKVLNRRELDKGVKTMIRKFLTY